VKAILEALGNIGTFLAGIAAVLLAIASLRKKPWRARSPGQENWPGFHPRIPHTRQTIMRKPLGLVAAAFSLAATATAAAAGNITAACLAFVGAAFAVITGFWREDRND